MTKNHQRIIIHPSNNNCNNNNNCCNNYCPTGPTGPAGLPGSALGGVSVLFNQIDTIINNCSSIGPSSVNSIYPGNISVILGTTGYIELLNPGMFIVSFYGTFTSNTIAPIPLPYTPATVNLIFDDGITNNNITNTIIILPYSDLSNNLSITALFNVTSSGKIKLKICTGNSCSSVIGNNIYLNIAQIL